MQSSKYLLIGLFSNIELNSFSNKKVWGYCYLHLKLILLLGYGGMDVDPCGPTIGLVGEFKSSMNTHLGYH